MRIEEQSPAEKASADRKAARIALQAEKNAKKKSPKPAAGSSPAKGKTESGKKKADKPSPALSVGNAQPPTLGIAQELQQAFDHFNRELFEGQLPQCVLTLTRLRKYAGLFAPKRWVNRSQKAKENDMHEIQVDAVVMSARGDKRALSTLVHEMVHLAVEHSGHGPKKAYHCKRWAAAMKELGLQPIAIVKGQQVSGKETGANCTHEIVKGGPFCQSADDLLKSGFVFSWGAIAEPEKVKSDKKKSKAGAKVAHVCPECNNKAWGKSSMVLVCGADKVEMECAERGTEGNDDDAE